MYREDDWPDGEEETEMLAADQNQPTVGEGVANMMEQSLDTVEEEDDIKRMSEASPSEIGNMI